ncbi:LysM peptidoglycan-binding domain-containing protein [Bacillus sp. ISL-47]|nr:LysM domain-containing protein [Bacillus sp. ISL-47]MBT2690841.1 LysM peptidoglycan-binding domain-containing protein [Bacillus sp. ISL-47]MBT2710803.1 LysM peptidoglycan-binding domain-containing protein [Pseudomonas sp. ISL-84]
MQIHTVQRGETLWGISQRYGVSINDIVTANTLEDNFAIRKII